MGLMARLLAGREIQIGEPTPPYTGELAPSIVAAIEAGRSDSWGWGEAVTRDIALSIPAFRRGLRVMTTAIASMPLLRYRGAERIERGTFLTQPEYDRPYVTTLTRTVEDLILYRHAWWLVRQRDGDRRPYRVVRVDPTLVMTERDPVTDIVTRATVMYRDKLYTDAELIRFDGPDEGVLTTGSGAILTALRAEMAASRYASPEVPTGYLQNTGEYDLTKTEANELLDEWEGARRRRVTAYLNRYINYVNPQSNARDLQLVESREEAALQIARALNLNPRYCNATSGDSMTYTNSTAERQDLIDLSLRAYVEPIEQRLSMNDMNGTPLGQTVRFDMDSFLRGDPAARASLYQTLIPLGVMTPEEARAAEPIISPNGPGGTA